MYYLNMCKVFCFFIIKMILKIGGKEKRKSGTVKYLNFKYSLHSLYCMKGFHNRNYCQQLC